MGWGSTKTKSMQRQKKEVGPPDPYRAKQVGMDEDNDLINWIDRSYFL